MTNKAKRQLGEVRLVWDAQDPDLLDQPIEIKRAQCRATGAFEYFASPPRRALEHRLAAIKVEGFECVLSRFMPVTHCWPHVWELRAGGFLPWWFPAYNREHADVAPGWILLRELIAAAPVNGLPRIDLGRREEDYKRRPSRGCATNGARRRR